MADVAQQIKDLHDMEAQLHQLYQATATVASRQHAVRALAMVLGTLREMGGAPSCTETPLQRQLTHSIESAHTLREMIAANIERGQALDKSIAGRQQLVDAKGGLERSKMSVALASECAGVGLAISRTAAELDSTLTTFQKEAAREARGVERLEVSAKKRALERRKKRIKKVTIVAVNSASSGARNPPPLPPTPYPKAPPAAPPPPSPAVGGGAVEAGAKLDLGGIKQAALLRDIQKQDGVSREFVEPPTNSRDAMLFEIQKQQKKAAERKIEEPVTNSRGDLLVEIQKAARSRSAEREPRQEEPPPASPRAQSPVKNLRANSPNSPRRHPSKQKYVPPTLKATSKALFAASAFGGIAKAAAASAPAPEPEPEPEPQTEIYHLTVPEGIDPESSMRTIEVELPDGRAIEIEVPEGLGPGDEFEAEVSLEMDLDGDGVITQDELARYRGDDGAGGDGTDSGAPGMEAAPSSSPAPAPEPPPEPEDWLKGNTVADAAAAVQEGCEF